MYATYDYTDADEVLLSCKEKLGIENTTTSDAKLRRFMRRALGELPSFQLGEYKVEHIPICDFKAELPCDFVRFVEPNGIRVNDGTYGCFYPRTVNGVMFYTQNENNYAYNFVQMNNGFLYFSNLLTATEVDIYYLALITDENGRQPIPTSHAEAIEEYMCYMWYRSIDDKTNASISKIRWASGKKAIKAKSTQPNVNEKEDIFAIRNSIL